MALRWRLLVLCVLAAGSAAADPPTDEAADPTAPLVIDASSAHEHPEGHDHGEEPIEVLVTADRVGPRAASAVSVPGGELRLRPKQSPASLVEATPGLFAVQHAGGGKAAQYFLRGFDADHGTDIAFYVDGVPVNMPSHGHGQGWTDLHFVIPELVASLDAYKGPYFARFGDFATAGAVELKLADHFDERRVSLSAGRFGILRTLAIFSEEVGEDSRVVVAAEAYAQDGPFENKEELERFNGFARVTHGLSPRTSAALTLMSYGSGWNASGQIPLREVRAGRLSRFGSIDPSEGGSTQRHAVDLKLESKGEEVDFRAQVYAIKYDFRLFSNFTFFLDDAANGDQIEQTDERSVLGTNVRMTHHEHYKRMRFQTTFGLQSRFDSIDNGLFGTAQRERLDTRVDARVKQSSVGFYVEEAAQLTPWLEVTPGLRFDRLDVSVDDRLDDPNVRGDSATGSRGAMLLSPKLAVVLSPHERLDLFYDMGRGFHSNDARGATRRADRTDLLVPAFGFEVGTRIRPFDELTLSAAGFRLDIESEQVFVGDAGTTEPSAKTSRYGIEIGARLFLSRYFFADADATFTRAEFRGNAGNAGSVALAPTRTFTGGVGFRTKHKTFASVRVRSIADRPATEDGRLTAEGWTVVDAMVGQRLGPFELTLEGRNLLDTNWRAVQFATESQLANETEPVEEIHFTPGWPLTVVATLAAYF